MTTTSFLEDAQALFSPQALKDPYPLYARARRHGAVLHVPEWGNAIVLGHAEASALLKDHRVSAVRGVAPPGMQDSAAYALLRSMMLFHDGASHARLRGLATQAFTPRAIAETRAFVEAAVDDLLDEAARRGDFDVVRDLAVPLPVAVIVEMLGLPGGDRERFKAWSESIAALLDGSTVSPETLPGIEADAREMRAYFRDVADELRANPRPGLLGALALAEAQGDRLSNDELLSNAVLLLAAGHETTTNLISGGVLALAQHPREWERLVQDEGVTVNAVEELLRFVNPVQGTGRVLVQDAEVGGVHLTAGTFLTVMTAAANRDPRRFERPDALDLTRESAKAHLAFAVGPHYCLGASLARLEGQVVFRRLADRFPRLSVPEQPLSYRHNYVLRGLTGLRATLH